jgi:ATP-dependent Lon protease
MSGLIICLVGFPGVGKLKILSADEAAARIYDRRRRSSR